MHKPNVGLWIVNAKRTLSKHSPEILTGMGIAGMVMSTVLAVKATPKAMRLIEEYEEDVLNGEDKATPKEVVKLTWKCYVPAAVTGLTSAACLIGASRVSLKRNAALATAYKLSETALTEYKEKVVETIGERKEQTVRDKVAEEQVNQNPVVKNEVIISGKGETLCLDPMSKRFFKSSIDIIKRAETTIKAAILNDPFNGYQTLNDFYDEIGLERTDLGDELGWSLDKGLPEIDFSSQIASDGQPCIVIEYVKRPEYIYL